MATTTGPLAVPAFRRLWLARFISNIGNGLAPTALAFGVLDLPGASADDLGFVLAAAAVPLVVFMPLGGVIADRLPRALVISTTDIVLSVLVAVQGLLLITGDATIGSLALLNVGAGFLNALWFPAFPGLVPGVLPEDQLQRGNGQIAIASNLGLIVGSAAAGALVVAFGAGVAILLDGITFLAAGVLVFTLRHATPATPSGESMLRDLRDGWRTFLSFRWLWVVVAAFAFFNAVVRGGLEVGGPVLMREAFDGPSSWAALQTANAIGFLVGAIVGTRMRVTRPLVMHQLAGMAIPLYLAALAFAAPMPVLLVLSFGVGVSLDVCYVLWSTSVQTHVPRASLSRASAFDAMGSVAFGPIGLAIAGPAVERLGLGGFFAASTALTVTSLVAPLLVRDVRDLRWRTDARPTVLFVCVHNAGRSQMAAGFLSHLAGDRVDVRSAGSVPADRINPVAVEAMAEVGIDIAGRSPRVLDADEVRGCDVVITMGCGDACPVFPGTRYLDWDLDDPAGRSLEDVRPIRDEIRRRVEGLISDLDADR